MSDVLNLIRDDLRDFKGYSSARKESGSTKIMLNANENPWGDSNRYPDQQPIKLRQGLAAYYKVIPEQLLMTRGSDEGIDLLMRLFCRAGIDSIITCPPTFGMYETSAQIQGIQTFRIPLMQQGYKLDVNSIIENCSDKVKLIFLCSPNNPTGNLIKKEEIMLLCKKLAGKSLVIVDEAYIEFADRVSICSEVDNYQNLVVLRTLSKAFGLAAIRLGTVIANTAIINKLQTILAPYPLPMGTINSALDALKEDRLKETQRSILVIKEEREKMYQRLFDLPVVEKVWFSSANFLLVQFKKNVESECLAAGIVLRNMESKMGIKNIFRITVGTLEENQEVVSLLEKLRCKRNIVL